MDSFVDRRCAAGVVLAAQRRGISMRQIARACGLSPSTVCAVADVSRPLRRGTVEAVLGCSLASVRVDARPTREILRTLSRFGWSRRKLAMLCGTELRVRGNAVDVHVVRAVDAVARDLGLRFSADGTVLVPPLSPSVVLATPTSQDLVLGHAC